MRIRKMYDLWRFLGPQWLAYRASYALRLRVGWVRRKTPAVAWADQPLSLLLNQPEIAESGAYGEYRQHQSPPFFFSSTHRVSYQPCLIGWDQQQSTPVAEADELVQGSLQYFSHRVVHTGFPPDWHHNPFTGQPTPSDRHWSQIGDSEGGDIKVIWEPNRFSFTYALVRAYWRTGDEHYAELFWRLVEDWRAKNPPQQGPNWKCGQEISFRVMAWCFGLYGFLDSSVTTPERVAILAQMIAVSGRRIASNLDYALSQRNNHGISEGLGLWTIGVLFPEFRDASKWQATGRRVLETQGRELVYDDGAFSQHSMNYHRLMLHDYVWALRLGDLYEQPFSRELKERIGKASAFLYQLQDEESGRTPNYGANDGALILPLDNCGYEDYRPVIQSAHYLTTGTRCYCSGPWDEDLLWMFGPEALQAPVTSPARSNLEASAGGYYALRSSSGFAFVRCASFRHRPVQADMLHVDVWWRGQNVALDAGTYSYNAPAPWDNSLARTAYHNTVSVDGLDQMERAGRFLWLPWLRGQVDCTKRSSVGCLAYWEGEHDGYHRLKSPVRHRRGIVRLDEYGWLVLDVLSSQRQHDYRLHWLLPDLPYQWDGVGGLKLDTPAGPYHIQMSALLAMGACSLVRAALDSPRGWRAPYYNDREPALSIDLTMQAETGLFWTLFTDAPCRVAADASRLRIEAEHWHATVNLRDGLAPALVSSISIAGTAQDQLTTP